MNKNDRVEAGGRAEAYNRPHEEARLALSLLAADPLRLGGLILHGPPGTGKSEILGTWPRLRPDLPFVEWPVAADRRAVDGGLDVEATLAEGRARRRPGLIERALGGILAIDGVARLTTEDLDALCRALDSGSYSVLATAGSRDEIPERLLDRVAFVVKVHGASPAARRRIVTGCLQETQEFIEDPRLAPPAALSTPLPPGDAIAALEGEAARLGVPGLRGLILAVRAALLIAAELGHPQPDARDLAEATRLVLEPRSRLAGDDHAEQRDEAPSTQPQPPSISPSGELTSTSSATEPSTTFAKPDTPGDSTPPANSDDLLGGLNLPAPLEGRRVGNRRSQDPRTARRGPPGEGSSGARVRPVENSHRTVLRRLDVLGTLLAAAVDRVVPASDLPALRVRPRHLRWQTPVSPRAGVIILALDASRSMGPSHLELARATASGILNRSHRSRHEVAFVAFSGQRASLAVPPTLDTRFFLERLDRLSAGGTTPLPSALAACLHIARQALRHGTWVQLFLFTDAAANITLSGGQDPARAFEEALRLARRVRLHGIRSVLVDVRRAGAPATGSERLASALAATLVRPGRNRPVQAMAASLVSLAAERGP